MGMGNPYAFLDPAMLANVQAAVAAAGGKPSYEGTVKPEEAPTTYSGLEQAGVAAGGNGAEPPAFEQAPAETGTSDAASRGESYANAVTDALINQVHGGTQLAGKLVYGENYAPVGGEKGQQTFEDTFDKAPQQAAEGLQKGADATEAESKELSSEYERYRNQLSDTAASQQLARQGREAELAARQQALDSQTESYTKNLSDSGAFWKNPGNILSAIAFALMPIGANDPNIGLKTLMGAIQQDFTNRKAIADGHLGALRSNIQGYRQLAGDAEMGDKLALAASYEVAAAEIERISSKYKGPKAQAAAQASIAELQGKAGLLRMEAYRKAVYQNPATVSPQAAQALEQGPGYTSFINKTPKPGQTGAPGAVPQPATTQPTSQSAPKLTPEQQKAVIAAGGKPPQINVPGAPTPKGDVFEQGVGRETAKEIDKLAPGLRERWLNEVSHVMTMAKAAGHKTDDSVKKYTHDYIVNTQKQIQEASKANQPLVKQNVAWATLQSDMAEVNQFFKGDQQKIQEFMGQLHSVAPGAAQKWDTFWTNLGYGRAESGSKARIERASERLRQLFAGQTAGFYHEHAGAALSPAEKAMLSQVISAESSWDQKLNFVRSQSEQATAAFLNTFAGDNSLARPLWQIQMAGTNLGYSRLDSKGRYPDRSTPLPKPEGKQKEPEPTKGVSDYYDRTYGTPKK